MSGINIGPARVNAVGADGRPTVQALFGSGQVAVADWALPFRYQAQCGDLLLVIGQAGRYWVTGIIRGRGKSQLAFQGNTVFQSAGRMQLGGGGGVRLESPAIRLTTPDLGIEAEHAIQHLGASTASVSGTIEERAGESSRMIDGNDEHVSGRHSTVAEHRVKVDGEMLRLS